MSKGDPVNLVPGEIPEDYHCECPFCRKSIGILRSPDGTPYSRLERRQYYDPRESGRGGHIAKTPLHLARWAIQACTKPGDWVLDPTAGAGTTLVEAITQGRNGIGMELQYDEVIKANLEKNKNTETTVRLRIGDARRIGDFLNEEGKPIQLVVNNPPYSGDEGDWPGGPHLTYQDGLPNLAFLKEGEEYWRTLSEIYKACADHLVPGGHFVIGVKDMMRRKKPYMLHLYLCQLLESIGLEFVGTAFLKHYPTTLFLNTYEKRYNVRPPLYQTISVFRRKSP